MAGRLTTAGRDAAINALLRGQALGAPATYFWAAFTADPGPTGSLAAEVVGGNYARVAYTASLANFSAPGASGTLNGRTTENSNLVSFPTASADWGSITHLALCSASTAGTIWVVFELAPARTVLASDTLTVPVGAADFELRDA
jgi:hypothetical protein